MSKKGRNVAMGGRGKFIHYLDFLFLFFLLRVRLLNNENQPNPPLLVCVCEEGGGLG